MNSQRKGSEFVRFIAVDLKGNVYEISKSDGLKSPLFAESTDTYALLRQFIANELLGSKNDNGLLPKHIGYMQGHDLADYCSISEKGHLKWLPKGLLIYRLLLDYAAELARDWGAFEMRNPMIIRGDHNVIGQLMGEFHERDYRVDGGRGICYLRYASDPGAFPFMQKVQFSHKQSPLKVYEEAGCFRNEQQGEVSGLKRVRHFTMTDMHAACSSFEEARKEFELLCYLFADLMSSIVTKGRWVLGWEGTLDFYELHKDWLIRIGKNMGVPAFFKLMPRMSHYFAMKNEFQALTEDKANIQISTVQWDIKDGPRFDIGFIDASGEKHPCPVIIHASSFGSIERAICAILENIALDEVNGQVPMFPDWLSPTQIRMVPVSEKHIGFVTDMCKQASKKLIRADIDDRNETLAKKIRDAEKEWIPYVAVMGDKEIASGEIRVRVRKTGRIETLSMEKLCRHILAERGDRPFRPLPLPVNLSKRPVFKR